MTGEGSSRRPRVAAALAALLALGLGALCLRHAVVQQAGQPIRGVLTGEALKQAEREVNEALGLRQASPEEAVSRLESLVLLYPDDPVGFAGARLGLIELCWANKQDDRAEELARAALKDCLAFPMSKLEHSRAQEVYWFTARFAVALGEAQVAEQALADARAGHAEGAYTSVMGLMLASHYSDQDEHEKALAHYRAVLETNPKPPQGAEEHPAQRVQRLRALKGMASIYEQEGKLAEAVETYEAILSEGPEAGSAIRLAPLHAQMGAPAKALGTLVKALAAVPLSGIREQEEAVAATTDEALRQQMQRELFRARQARANLEPHLQDLLPEDVGTVALEGAPSELLQAVGALLEEPSDEHALAAHRALAEHCIAKGMRNQAVVSARKVLSLSSTPKDRELLSRAQALPSEGDESAP